MFCGLFGNSASPRLSLYFCDPLRRRSFCCPSRTTVCSPGGRHGRPQARQRLQVTATSELPDGNAELVPTFRIWGHRNQKAACVLSVTWSSCPAWPVTGAGPSGGSRQGAPDTPHGKPPQRPGRTQGREGGFRRKETLRKLGVTKLCPSTCFGNTQTHLETNVT